MSVIFVSYNTRELTLIAIDRLKKSVRDPEFRYEIILVDNASHDGSVEAVRSAHPDVILLPLDDNIGFGQGNNRGAERATGELLFFLNTDTEIFEGSLEALYTYMAANPELGGAGARLQNPDGTYQRSILRFPSVWRIFCEFFWLDRLGPRVLSGPFDNGLDPETNQIIEVAHGAAMVVRRSVYEQVGGFDPDFFMYFEECDLCRRITDANWKIGYTPTARVMHHVSASSQARPWWFYRIMRRSRMIYASKHFNPISRLIVRVIVPTGYLTRIIGFGIAGLGNQRLQRLSSNILKSYIKKSP